MFGRKKSPEAPAKRRAVSPVNAMLDRWRDSSFYLQMDRELSRKFDSGFSVEIKKLHGERETAVARITTSNVLSLSRDISGWRSRLTTIEQKCLARASRLEQLSKRLRKAVMAGDSHFLSELARNATDKEAIIDTLLADANNMINRYEIIREVCRLEIADLDKSAWTVKAYLDELAYERENAGR